jgi:hypothetical protein
VAFTFANVDGATYVVYLACGDTTLIEIFDQMRAAKQWGGDTQPLRAGNRFGPLCLEVAGIAELRQTLAERGWRWGRFGRVMIGRGKCGRRIRMGTAFS